MSNRPDALPAARATADVAAMVRQSIADVLAIDAAAIKDDQTLLALGAQSFDFVDVILRIEEQLGVAIPRSYAIPADYSVGDLVAAVAHLTSVP